MVEMKNIKGKPTLMINKDDLNIIMSCPYCNAKNDRIIHGTKKWKCLDCFKSFKKPKIIGRDASIIENVKTFNNKEIREPTPLVDIVPDPELVEFSDKLPNEGVPSFDKSHIDEADSLITDSKEIEKINKKSAEIVAERIVNNPELLSKISKNEIFVKSDLPSMIKLSDKIEDNEQLNAYTEEQRKENQEIKEKLTKELSEPQKTKRKIIVRKK